MIHSEIYNDVIGSFSGLWSFKERQGTLEIITPFATTSHKFISVFLTQRDDEYIVSDGGWISDGVYENDFNRGVGCYAKIVSHYIESFEVKETNNNQGLTYFYKKTSRKIAVASIIFDMSNFISSLVSLANVEYELERKPYDLFSKNANIYLQAIFKNRFEHNVFFDLTHRHVKPSGIIRKENGNAVLLNYITGTNATNFQNSIGKALLVFTLAEKAVNRDKIEKKITLIDDNATGYDFNRVEPSLSVFSDIPKIKRVDWSNKEELLTV